MGMASHESAVSIKDEWRNHDWPRIRERRRQSITRKGTEVTEKSVEEMARELVNGMVLGGKQRDFAELLVSHYTDNLIRARYAEMKGERG